MDIKIVFRGIYTLLAVFCSLGGFVFWTVIASIFCEWLEDTREIRKQIARQKYLTNDKLYDIIKSNIKH